MEFQKTANMVSTSFKLKTKSYSYWWKTNFYYIIDWTSDSNYSCIVSITIC